MDDLRSRFRGPIALGGPDDAAVRNIWNDAIDRQPAVFARCTQTEDIITSLRFAREHDLEMAVRSGGHNVAGTALTNGGVSHRPPVDD